MAVAIAADSGIPEAFSEGLVETIDESKLVVEAYIKELGPYYRNDIRNTNMALNRLFQQSVKGGRLAVVMALVRLGVNPLDEHNWALCIAAERGYTDIVVYLIDRGANINALGCTPIVQACMSGRLAVVKLLVARGAHYRYSDDWPLCISARSGHLHLVDYLITKGANPRAYSDLPLTWASKNGHLEVIKALVDAGVPISLITNSNHLRYLTFCKTMALRLRERAQKKIFFWWIPICYDMTLEVGQRMFDKNLQKYMSLMCL